MLHPFFSCYAAIFNSLPFIGLFPPLPSVCLSKPTTSPMSKQVPCPSNLFPRAYFKPGKRLLPVWLAREAIINQSSPTNTGGGRFVNLSIAAMPPCIPR